MKKKMLPNAGHFIFHDRTAAFASSAVGAFLDKVNALT